MSLFQTALIHAGETQKGGKGGRLKSSEGEALVSSAGYIFPPRILCLSCLGSDPKSFSRFPGGVGVLGTFGDVTKSRLKANRWHRVAVSVKCATDAKQKGEMLTWIDAVSGGLFSLSSTHLTMFPLRDVWFPLRSVWR